MKVGVLKMNTYKCYVEFDNGVTIKNKTVIIFTENKNSISDIVYKFLCKNNDDSITILKIEQFYIKSNDIFEIIN